MDRDILDGVAVNGWPVESKITSGAAARPLISSRNFRQRLLAFEREATHYRLLLQEADHRIKNSLQVVASLMRLEAARVQDATASNVLRSAAGRVQSIASIHDALQLTGGENSIELGAVLTTMCLSLHAMAGDPRRISITVKAESIEVPVSLAQPMVLAVNELVVNALRHAFPNGRSGVVHVDARIADGMLCIEVADDGVGLNLEPEASRGFGMKLVRTMVDQIGGKISIDSLAGASFTILAPMPEKASTLAQPFGSSEIVKGV